MAGSDPNQYKEAALHSPFSNAVDLGIGSDVDLGTPCRGFMVGAAGNVKITTTGGDVVTLTNLSPGVVYPWRCKRIWATGTTATGIIAGY